MMQVRIIFYGAGYVLDQISKQTGVYSDLKAIFPEQYKQILSIAYYLIFEGNNTLSRFSHWQKLHHHQYCQDIPSQRSTDLFQTINEKGRRKKEYWAFDTISISSYS